MKISLLYIVLFLAVVSGFGQTVISSTGQSSTSGNVMIESTIGETIITTEATTEAILTQGFHQPSIEVTAVDENEVLNITYFPNPSKDVVFFEGNQPFKIQVYDLKGAILISKNLESATQQIDFSTFENGVYLVKVTGEDSNSINTYKIFKE